MAVTDSDKVLVMQSSVEPNVRDHAVDVYKTDGQFVDSFGEGIKHPWYITAANDGRVMIVESYASCVHVFSEDGNHLNEIKLVVTVFSLLVSLSTMQVNMSLLA